MTQSKVAAQIFCPEDTGAQNHPVQIRKVFELRKRFNRNHLDYLASNYEKPLTVGAVAM